MVIDVVLQELRQRITEAEARRDVVLPDDVDAVRDETQRPAERR